MPPTTRMTNAPSPIAFQGILLFLKRGIHLKNDLTEAMPLPSEEAIPVTNLPPVFEAEAAAFFPELTDDPFEAGRFSDASCIRL
ncbi:MAG: hypothetical protein IKI74_02440 [Christensenellaceae bacterium]|nr:hypothetical protein [Christensenellaceae bacterium]